MFQGIFKEVSKCHLDLSVIDAISIYITAALRSWNILRVSGLSHSAYRNTLDLFDVVFISNLVWLHEWPLEFWM